MSLIDEGRRIPAAELAPGAPFPYEKILLTFADLPRVEEVFQLALHLAAGAGRELCLLRVVPTDRAESKMPANKESLYSELRAIHMLLGTEEIPARLEAAPIPDAASIAAYAEERGVDLIVAIGRAANGERYRRLVEELLRQAPCTAMLLNLASPGGEQAAGRPIV